MVGAVTVTIENPWVGLLIFNVFGLFVLLFWMIVGAWWDKRKGVETISKAVWLTLIALLYIPANVLAVVAIMRTS